MLVADSISQCVHHGECCHAVNGKLIEESAILEFGNAIENKKLGRTSDGQISIVDSTDVAIQDRQVAKMVNHFFQEARRVWQQ